MKAGQILALLDNIAPFALAEEWEIVVIAKNAES